MNKYLCDGCARIMMAWLPRVICIAFVVGHASAGSPSKGEMAQDPSTRRVPREAPASGVVASTRESKELSIAVVVSPNDAPAAGAVLEYCRFGPSSRQCWAGSVEPSRHVSTDKTGSATLRGDRTGILEVRGRLGRFCGKALIPEGVGGPFTLRLFPGVPVSVVDGGGTARDGVPVALVSQGTSGRIVVDRAVTGLDGVAYLLADSQAESRAARTYRLLVTLGIPLSERIELECERAPMKLVLPATCSIGVAIRGKDSTAADSRTLIQVRTASVPDRYVNADDPSVMTATINDGLARFPYVGIGVALRLLAVADGECRTAQVLLDPVSEPTALTVTIPSANRLARIRGRILDHAGSPVRGTRVGLSVKGSCGPLGPINEVWTDNQGAFEAKCDIDAMTLAASKVDLWTWKDFDMYPGATASERTSMMSLVVSGVTDDLLDLGKIRLPADSETPR